jgi:hypothetical protein
MTTTAEAFNYILIVTYIQIYWTNYNGRRNMYGCKVNVVYEPPEDDLI